jgi:hypothetical protein
MAVAREFCFLKVVMRELELAVGPILITALKPVASCGFVEHGREIVLDPKSILPLSILGHLSLVSNRGGGFLLERS